MLSAMMGKQWMEDSDFIRRWVSGELVSKIIAHNKRVTGWSPTKSAVLYHAGTLELQPRNAHSDLLPGPIRPEHRNRYYKMLTAEGRRRRADEKYGEGNGYAKISRTDQKYVNQLEELLHGFGRGARLVIGYDPVHICGGWYLVDEQPWDTDIVRRPQAAKTLP